MTGELHRCGAEIEQRHVVGEVCRVTHSVLMMVRERIASAVQQNEIACKRSGRGIYKVVIVVLLG